MKGFCLGGFVQGDFVRGDFVLGDFVRGDFVLEPIYACVLRKNLHLSQVTYEALINFNIVPDQVRTLSQCHVGTDGRSSNIAQKVLTWSNSLLNSQCSFLVPCLFFVLHM